MYQYLLVEKHILTASKQHDEVDNLQSRPDVYNNL